MRYAFVSKSNIDLDFKTLPLNSKEALSSPPSPSTNESANTVRFSLITVKSPTIVPAANSHLDYFLIKKTVGNLSSFTAISKAF
jgi:hypothetical protein